MTDTDPFSANSQTQIGVETTPGTPVAAGLLLPTLKITLDPDFAVTKYKGKGRRFTSLVVPAGDEGVKGKAEGGLTFTEFPYLASMIWGDAAITTPGGGAVNARQWRWVVPLSGRVNPRSTTIEQGDEDDAERASYSVLQDIDLELTRRTNAVTGTLQTRAIEKAETGGAWEGMTANPELIPLTPVTPRAWDVYMDDQPQGSGTGTKMTRSFKAKISYGGAFEAYFPMDSSLTSFAGLADKEDIAASLLMTLARTKTNEKLWATARAGRTKFVRVKALGDAAENFRAVSTTGTPDGGSFTLTYKGVTSGAINYNANAAAVQSVLEQMSNIGVGNVKCSGGALPTAVRVDFIGSLINDPITNTFTLGANNLTGGTSPVPVFGTPVLIQSLFQVDMAVKVTKPGGDQATESVRTRDWEFEIVEDPAMNGGTGGALIVTVVTSVQSLT